MKGDFTDVFIRPVLENDLYKVILTGTVCSFILQHAFYYFTPLFLPRFKHLTEVKKIDWCIRAVSIAHCIMSFSTIPGYLWPSDACKGKVDPATGNTLYNHYCYEESAQIGFALSTGYFIWDVIVSFYYDWGLMYKVHAVLTLFVFFFACYPFLHHWGRYFHGIYETSTLLLHLRGMLEVIESQNTTFYKLVEYAFAGAFSVVRIGLGFTVTFFWAKEMWGLYANGTAHSDGVILFYLGSATLLSGLQAWWFFLILKAALGFEMATDARKEKKN